MKVKELIQYLEKIPVAQEELLEMELQIRVPTATGQLTQYVGVKDAHIIDIHNEPKVELTTSFVF